MPENRNGNALSGMLSSHKRILTIVGVIVVLALAIALRGFLLRSTAMSRDFITYWASAKLLVAHQNPYDRLAVLRLEAAAGATYQQPFLMRNPPWALFMALPLAWFRAPAGALVWMLAIIAAALASIMLLKPRQLKQVPLTLLFFAPTLMCAGAEQTGLFILLALALFCRCARRQPFWAGAALTVACAKPHLLLLLWPIVLLESWRRREIRILAGLAAGLFAATAVALIWDPQVGTHYLASMRAEHVEADFYPNLASLLRVWIAPEALWPAAIPTVSGLAVVAWYWKRSRREWQWSRQGAMIVAVSILTAPYSWPTDQVLFLPVLLQGAAQASKRALASLVLLNGCALLVFVRNPLLGKPIYLWMAPAWMLWAIWVWLWPTPDRDRQETTAEPITDLEEVAG